MKKATVSLEEAQAIVLAAREAEAEQKAKANARFIGRCFKYRNRYGGDGESWWLYGMVQSSEAYSGCRGWTFQRPTDHRIEIDMDARVSVEIGGWAEITASEFWAAAAETRQAAAEFLNPDTAKGLTKTAKAAPKKAARARKSK